MNSRKVWWVSRATSQYGIGQYLALIILLRPAGACWTFTVNAVDYLGNAGCKSVMFMIIVTTKASGKLALTKLASAAKARAKGDCANAATIYVSFISEVQAQEREED